MLEHTRGILPAATSVIRCSGFSHTCQEVSRSGEDVFFTAGIDTKHTEYTESY